MSSTSIWPHLIKIILLLLSTMCCIFVIISTYKRYKKTKVLTNSIKATFSICIGMLISAWGSTIFHGNDAGEILSVLLGAVFFIIIPIILLLKSAYRTDNKRI